MKKWMIITALTLALAPSTARADWLFTPNLGTTFGGDSGNHLTYGASLGWMGAGIFGFEADFSFTPEFFDRSDAAVDLDIIDDLDFLGDSSASSVMFNAIVGVPIGGTTGGGFRPYVTGGVGMLHTELTAVDELFEVSNNDFGFNLGGGAMGYATDHVGFRGDIRYLRSFEDLQVIDDLSAFGETLDVGKSAFWRATGGLTFRW